MIVKIKKISENVVIPHRSTDQSAGYDLYAFLSEDVVLSPLETKIIPTGIFLEIPDGYFGMVCPRSGLSAKHGITVLNSPGIIDSDYRGEIKCILTNISENKFVISDNMRIAQLLIMKFESVSLIESSKEFSETKRGENGFGSTGY